MLWATHANLILLRAFIFLSVSVANRDFGFRFRSTNKDVGLQLRSVTTLWQRHDSRGAERMESERWDALRFREARDCPVANKDGSVTNMWTRSDTIGISGILCIQWCFQISKSFEFWLFFRISVPMSYICEACLTMFSDFCNVFSDFH